jgi:hypothetical protein
MEYAKLHTPLGPLKKHVVSEYMSGFISVYLFHISSKCI